MRTVQFLKELHDGALDYTKNLHFDKTRGLHFLLASLYGTLIEFTGCMLMLLENRGKSGIPTIFRTFLETYVEFHNLVRDPAYGYHIEANDLKESIKRLKSAKRGNPYLAEIASRSDLLNLIDSMERQLGELESMTYKALNIYERFKRADMTEEYESLYSLLSSHSHSNKEALIDRHVELGDEDFTLVLYKNPPDEEFLWVLDSTAGLLVSATIDIHEHLQSGVVTEVLLFKDKLDQIRSSDSPAREADVKNL